MSPAGLGGTPEAGAAAARMLLPASVREEERVIASGAATSDWAAAGPGRQSATGAMPSASLASRPARPVLELMHHYAPISTRAQSVLPQRRRPTQQLPRLHRRRPDRHARPPRDHQSGDARNPSGWARTRSPSTSRAEPSRSTPRRRWPISQAGPSPPSPIDKDVMLDADRYRRSGRAGRQGARHERRNPGQAAEYRS
jgi:hypothetical protein